MLLNENQRKEMMQKYIFTLLAKLAESLASGVKTIYLG